MGKRGAYARVRSSFWTEPKIKRGLTTEQKALFLYYITSPHSNMIGLYYLPLDYAASETGIPLDRVKQFTAGPLSDFVTYDPETEEILVHKAALHQVDRQLKETDNRLKAVQRILDEAHSPHLITKFLDLYDWPVEVLVHEPEGALKPIETPSEPLPSHSSSSSSKHSSSSNSSVDKSTGQSPSDNDFDQGDYMGVVRDQAWAPDGKAPDGWDGGREISTAGQVMENYRLDWRGLAEVVEAVAWMRDRRELEGFIEPEEKFTARIFNRAKEEGIPLVIQAAHYREKRLSGKTPEEVRELVGT